MNLRALRVFVGLMDGGTLTRAAERMNLSQSAASRLLTLLEAELGAQLFARERRRMMPMPAAEALYPEALRILAQTDSLRDVVRSDRPAPVRILCQTRLLPGLVVPAIALLRHQSTRPIQLEAAPRRELARRVQAARHDVVVATMPLPLDRALSASAVTVPLASVALGILVPVRHPLANAQTLDLEDLDGMAYIALDETTVIRRMVDSTHAALPPPAIEVSTGAAAYRLVAAGLGFTFADPIAVDPELSECVALVPWRRRAIVEIGCATPADELAGDCLAAVEAMRQVAAQI